MKKENEIRFFDIPMEIRKKIIEDYKKKTKLPPKIKKAIKQYIAELKARGINL